MRAALARVGMLAVTLDAAAAVERDVALREFVRCIGAEGQSGAVPTQAVTEATRAVVLEDGTVRTTIAVATNHSVAQPLPVQVSADAPWTTSREVLAPSHPFERALHGLGANCSDLLQTQRRARAGDRRKRGCVTVQRCAQWDEWLGEWVRGSALPHRPPRNETGAGERYTRLCDACESRDAW